MTVAAQLLTNDGLDLPSEPDANLLRNYKRGTFVLEGEVHSGLLEVELTINTLAFLDYSITLEKY